MKKKEGRNKERKEKERKPDLLQACQCRNPVRKLHKRKVQLLK
jgi:hypothetical protein